MRGYLKCYYGYKNRGDELLFFGVLDWIKNYTPVTHIDIESGDVDWMQKRAKKHEDTLETIGMQYTFIDKKNHAVASNDSEKYRNNVHTSRPMSSKGQSNKTQLSPGQEYDLYFFGGGEVINDQDNYLLPANPSIKNYCYHVLSRLFTRSGWNYYLQYRKIIQSGKFFLLGGIGNPYKYTTKRLYKKLLPKAKGIVARDTTSYQLALSYNTHTTLYHDFSHYMIAQFRNNKKQITCPFDPDSYILINTQDHTRSDKTLTDIQAFVDVHTDKKPIFFPCDMQDDSKYFAILQKHIPSLQLYDWTDYSVYETLALFAHASGGIGSRLHFLYPLHSFGKTYTSTATKDKVAKLLSPTPIDVV